MTQISIVLRNGRSIAFDVREDGEGPPCFLMSVRKCGSTLANSVCRALVNFNKRCFVDVGGSFFRNNIVAREWQRDPALGQIVRPEVIYGGFREAPMGMFANPDFLRAPKLVVIRDPRDALVSEYFSNAFSHPVPAKSGEFDNVTKLILEQREAARSGEVADYVLKRTRDMARTFEGYAEVLGMPNTFVLKYEDMVFDKRLLIDRLDKMFGLKSHPSVVKNILEWADVRPDSEDPTAFVRQVSPGDHKRKLDVNAIAQMNEVLARPMELFGYSA